MVELILGVPIGLVLSQLDGLMTEDGYMVSVIARRMILVRQGQIVDDLISARIVVSNLIIIIATPNTATPLGISECQVVLERSMIDTYR